MMKKLLYILSLAMLVTSCQASFMNEDADCDYNLDLRFNYNLENSVNNNQITSYLNSLTVYIFNDQGILVASGEAGAAFESKLMLDPGRYTVIGVGNLASHSVVDDPTTTRATALTLPTRATALTTDITLPTRATEQITKANLMLTLSDLSFIDGYAQQSERLYYAYRAFTVLPNTMNRVRVDVVHAHCQVSYTIKWATPPTDDFESYFVQLRDLPSEYSLVPEFAFPRINQWATYDNAVHDYFTGRNQDVIHYLPTVLNQSNVVTYRKAVSKSAGSIMGQTINYRLRQAGHAMFALYGRASDGTTTRLMNEVDLNKFLTDLGADLDHTLRQEYEVVFTIQPDGRVLVNLVGVGDWDEGEW